MNGSQNMPDDRYNLTRSLSEYRFSFDKIGRMVNIKGLVAQIEYNDITPGGGEILRFGMAYRHTIAIPSMGKIGGLDGWLQWRANPFETDGDGGQASLIYYNSASQKKAYKRCVVPELCRRSKSTVGSRSFFEHILTSKNLGCD